MQAALDIFKGRTRGLLPGPFARVLLLAAMLLPAAAAQQTGDSAQWLQFIGLELRQLRIELLEQRVATETDSLLQVERDLMALRLAQNKNRKDEQSQTLQLAELQKQANDPGADAQAQAHIQALVGELASNADNTRVSQSALATREAELNERLRAAKLRVQAMMGRLKQLSSTDR